MVLGVGGALANHVPQVDPATVPVGFLATHNRASSLQIAPLARAIKHHRAFRPLRRKPALRFPRKEGTAAPYRKDRGEPGAKPQRVGLTTSADVPV